LLILAEREHLCLESIGIEEAIKGLTLPSTPKATDGDDRNKDS
jgi:hypothetical protein